MNDDILAEESKVENKANQPNSVEILFKIP